MSFCKLAQAVDFYLSPAGEPHLAKIQKLARQSPSKQTDVQLFGYAMEAVRLTGMSASREACGSETIVEDDGRRVSVRAGDRVFVNLVCLSIHCYVPVLFPPILLVANAATYFLLT